MSASDRILIAGAGPVGYAAALNLATRGIPFILFESGPDIFKDPRAGTIHPPSVEMFDQLGIAKTLIERGYIVSRYHYRDRKQGLIADFDLGLLAEDTPFPFRLMLEQHKVSAIIHAKLGESASHRILRNHRVVDVRQDDGGVVATVETPDGVETFDGRYMIGCDGGRSQVRKCMSVAFDGFTYPERFLIVTTPYDFEKVGYAQTNYVADPEEWCALFKVPGADDSGIWRVVFRPTPGSPRRTCSTIYRSSAASKGSTRRTGFTMWSIATSMRSINGWRVPIGTAASCSPGTPRTSTIRSAAWA